MLLTGSVLLLVAAILSHHAKDWADVLRLAACALAVAAIIRVSRVHYDDAWRLRR